MKPTIFYIDDEPHNLTVFEAALSDSWDIKVFSHPVKAIEALESEAPCIIVTDQRMPVMSGVQFLEIARKIAPFAIRIIVTGYSDEDLIVESVRKAQIFDYIKKPWDVGDLESSLNRAWEFFKANAEARDLQKELLAREQQLKEQNARLVNTLTELEAAKRNEQDLRKELEFWVPPLVRWAVTQPDLKFPIKRDIVGITFDIIGSSQFHDVQHLGRPLRGHVIQLFTEMILRYGGWRESLSGDSAYGHFGLTGGSSDPSEAAIAVARDFRVGLRGLARTSGASVECGIALHIAKNCTVDVHTVQLQTPHGLVSQKSFDTTSSDIDILHRMEKLVHSLSGSNIIMSEEFLQSLRHPPSNVRYLGKYKFVAKESPIRLHLIPSDRIQEKEIQDLEALGIEKSSA